MKAAPVLPQRSGESLPETMLNPAPGFATARPGPFSKALTILVVDDYRSVGEMIADMLRAGGYSVLTAGSGEDAKAQARVHQVDLLLTDMEMPQMRGDELAAWFRSARAETQILFMSGRQAEAQGLDPSRLLQKPIKAETLMDKVREVLNHHTQKDPAVL